MWLVLTAISLSPALAGAAPRDLLTVMVAPSPGVDRSPAGHAIAVARAEGALQRSRAQYAASRFAACAKRLERAARQLSLARSPAAADGASADGALLKRVEQWLGLCRAGGGDDTRARHAFARANRLPGPDPDPQVFPPAVMQLYRSAAGDRVDGTQPRDAAALATGPQGPSALTSAEADDPRLLQRIGRAARARRLLLVFDRADRLQLAVFDVDKRQFIERRETAAGPGQLLLAAGASVVTAPLTPAPASAAPATAGAPWYKRWWVWTLIGVGAAAAVTIPLIATQPTRYEITF